LIIPPRPPTPPLFPYTTLFRSRPRGRDALGPSSPGRPGVRGRGRAAGATQAAAAWSLAGVAVPVAGRAAGRPAAVRLDRAPPPLPGARLRGPIGSATGDGREQSHDGAGGTHGGSGAPGAPPGERSRARYEHHRPRPGVRRRDRRG